MTLDEIELALRQALGAVQKAKHLRSRKDELVARLAGAALDRVKADPILGSLFERALRQGEEG